MGSKDINVNTSSSGMAIGRSPALSERKISSKNEVLGGVEEQLGEDKMIEEYEQAAFYQDLAHLAELIDKRLLKYVKWTEIETGWRLLQKEGSEVVEKRRLRNVIASKFKESFAGEMLLELNDQQPISEELQLTKIGIIKQNLTLNEFPKTYERLNYYVDDIMKLLEKCLLSSPDGITLPLLMFKTPLLRFTNCQISTMDKCLMNYDNLQALILASNYLSDFPGAYLPRNLKLLELYGNLMYHIDLLCTEAPPRLFYLGIGRNYLNPESGIINLLLLQNLCHLDLSDNDFENLDGLLETFSSFLRLESLELIGNPCSLSINYERKVQKALSTLIYLDGELLESWIPFEKQDKKDVSTGDEACLQVHVFRIMGFKQGSDKGSKKKAQMNQKYRMEIELPLLDNELREYEIQQLLLGDSGDQQAFEEPPVPLIDWYTPIPVTPEVETDDQQNQKENETASKEQKTKAKNPTKEVEPTKEDKPTKAGKRDKKATKVVKPSKANNQANAKAAKLAAKKLLDAAIKEREEELKAVEQRYYNYLTRDRRPPIQTKFVSTTTKWAKVMEFKNPCIEVPVPWYMLRKLRDTLRSKVILRLVEIEKKEKTKKETKKGKKDKKEEKKEKGKKGKKKGKEEDTKSDEDDKKKKKKGKKGKPEDEAEEKQGKKSRGTKDTKNLDSVNETIAKIAVPLEVLKWSENYMGFMWDIKRFCFARPYPGIEDVKYKLPKEKKKAAKTKDKKKKINKEANEEEEEVIMREIPTYLTCHFAIGLKREARDTKASRVSKLAKKPKSKANSDHKRSFKRKNKRLENTILGLLENLNQQGETFNSIRNEYENLEAAAKLQKQK